jgi:hypothetical protein
MGVRFLDLSDADRDRVQAFIEAVAARAGAAGDDDGDPPEGDVAADG